MMSPGQALKPQFVSNLPQSIRAGRAALAAWAAWVGGEVGAGAFDVARALSAALAAALVLVAGTLFEQVLTPRDRIPDTPSSGPLSRRSAIVVSMLAAAVGCALAALTGWRPFILALLAIVMLVLFAVRARACLIPGDFIPPIVAALSFIFGALAQGESLTTILPHAWIAAGFVGLWLLAVQWISGAATDPDLVHKSRRSLSFVIGVYDTCRAAAVTLWLIAALVWIPFARGLFDFTYLVLVGIGVFPLLVVTALYLWSVPDRVRLAQIARLLGFGLAVLVGAIWFGAR